MKILRLFGVSCCFIMLFLSGVYAQSQQIQSKIQERGEAVVIIDDYDKKLLPFIAKNASIDKISENNLILYLNNAQFQKMTAFELNMQLYAPYYDGVRALTMANSLAEMENWDKYPTWDVFQDMMIGFANDYPELASLDTIGFSIENRAILGLKVSDNVAVDEIEPEFFLVGQIHGDEIVSYILTLRVIDYLLTNYGDDAEVTNMVNEMEIWFAPASNPDGTYGNNENDISNSTRYNADGVDLNRNYPDAEEGDSPDGNPTAIENLVMIDFAAERHFVMSANSHSGAELVNYPWDTWETLHADDDWWYEVSRAYADDVHANAPSTYLDGYDDGITNGYQWYSISGGRQDYMNYFRNCREVTLELSNEKLLDAELLPDHWVYNKDALLGYIQQAMEGVHGIVTDSITDEPLEATVFIENHDIDNSQVYSKLPNGDYHRLLKAGEWDLKFSAEGYKSKTITVNLAQDERIDLNVELVSLSELPPTVEFFASSTAINCNPEVQFFNESEAAGDLSFAWDFGDGNQSNEENPMHTYMQNGNYTVSLFLSNENGSDEIVKTNYVQVQLVSLDSVNSAAICSTSNGSVDLAAYSAGDIYWYENLTDETHIATGETFTTPNLNESYTYYAQAVFEGEINYVGEPDNSEDGDYDNTESMHYLIFDVLDNCILQEVTVYTENSGERAIYLRNSSGEVLQETTANIDAGEQTIALNFDLQAGENYQLAASVNSGLFKGRLTWTSVFGYPYEIESLISIKDSDAGVGWGSSEQVYPYFYNWKIKASNCMTERMPVYAIIGDAPSVDYSYEMDGLSVAFQSHSTYYTEILWNFGDENFSTEINPTHVYAEPGEYNVTLIATSDCGEAVFFHVLFLSNALFENNDESECQIFPNPASNQLTIQFQHPENYSMLELVDVTGKIIKQQSVVNQKVRLSVSDLYSGIYSVRFIRKDGGVAHQKIMIKH